MCWCYRVVDLGTARFLSLEGKNSAERPDRKLKPQRVFYLAKPKESAVEDQRA